MSWMTLASAGRDTGPAPALLRLSEKILDVPLSGLHPDQTQPQLGDRIPNQVQDSLAADVQEQQAPVLASHQAPLRQSPA